MSPGARFSRIYVLENMLATSSSTIISMASHLSQAEERERAFSGKGRWNHVRSLADAKTVMNNLFNLASSSRCHLWDKEVACREKDSEIRGLKEKIVSLIRQVEMQKAELTHQEKLNAALSDKLAEVNDTKRKPLSDIHNKIVKSNALNTAARKQWRKSVAIQLVPMASDQPSSQTQEPEAPKKQETSTTEPNVAVEKITPNASGVAPEQMSVDSSSRNSLDGKWGSVARYILRLSYCETIRGLHLKDFKLRALRALAKKMKVPHYTRYKKLELARRLLEERGGGVLHREGDHMINHTARELRNIAKERKIPSYTLYKKLDLARIFGLVSADLPSETAEQEKARQLGSEVGPSEARGSKTVQLEETETLASSIGR
ncbi:kinesin-like protein KIN-4C [Tanacetum coccineum]